MDNKILELLKEKYNKIEKGRLIQELERIDNESSTYKIIKNTKLRNEYVNERFEKFNNMNKEDLCELVLTYKIPIFYPFDSENMILLNKIIEIYDNFKNFNLDHFKLIEFFIDELKKQNIEIDNISEELIHLINKELDNQLSNILEEIINIYQIYDNELSKEYAIICSVCNEYELHCYKAKIISKNEFKILEKNGVDEDAFIKIKNKRFYRDEMKFLTEVDLNDYIDWNEITLKAFNSVKKKFPKGTTFLLVNN